MPKKIAYFNDTFKKVSMYIDYFNITYVLTAIKIIAVAALVFVVFRLRRARQAKRHGPSLRILPQGQERNLRDLHYSPKEFRQGKD